MIIIICSVLVGATGMYFIQRRERLYELEKIELLIQSVSDGKELQATAAGEESLYAKIEYQIIRTQEMLRGREEETRKNRDKMQKLISEIAHQMRTPLTNIRTYQDFLKQKMREENIWNKDMKEISVSECMIALEKSEAKLNFLVESFIKMSRLEQHIIQIKKEDKDILKTIKNVLGDIQPNAEKKCLQFDISMPEHVDCLHDANWLGEAIYNVLDNAVKYSNEKGTVQINVSENEMFLHICIRDFGLGIEQNEENKIFQRFYRGVRVTTQEGLGIGLYLSREIANLHGGFLRVKRMQSGLLMEIRIPC